MPEHEFVAKTLEIDWFAPTFAGARLTSTTFSQRRPFRPRALRRTQSAQTSESQAGAERQLCHQRLLQRYPSPRAG